MKDYISERVIALAEYIIDNESTVRATAKNFGISKSTVHKDISERLPMLNKALASKAKNILDKNKAERHIRGGIATKNKFASKSKGK